MSVKIEYRSQSGGCQLSILVNNRHAYWEYQEGYLIGKPLSKYLLDTGDTWFISIPAFDIKDEDIIKGDKVDLSQYEDMVKSINGFNHFLEWLKGKNIPYELNSEFNEDVGYIDINLKIEFKDISPYIKEVERRNGNPEKYKSKMKIA